MEEKIKERIKKVLKDSEVKVSTIDGLHFVVEVCAKEFANLKRIEQHRLILNSVSDIISSNEIHALQIKTKVL